MGISKHVKGMLVLGILLVAAVIYFAVSQLSKADAEDFYFAAEGKNFEKIALEVDEYYTTFIEKQKPYKEVDYRRRTEITADIQTGVDTFGLSNSVQVMELIRKAKLVIDSKVQPKSGASVTEGTLLIEKAPFLDAELLIDKEMLYLSVPVVMPGKYYSAKLNQLDEVYDKFSVPIKPKKLVNELVIAENLNFDLKAFAGAAGKLGDVFKKYMTKDTVQYGKDKDLTISDQLLEGREVLVSLNEESATSLLHELASAISEEDVLIRYLYGNYADLSTLFGDAGLFSLLGYFDETGAVTFNDSEKGLIDQLYVEKDIEGFKKSFRDLFNSYRLKNGLQMKIIIDKAGNILDRKLKLDFIEQKGNKSFTVDINTGSSNKVFEDVRNRFANVTVTDADNGKITELQLRPVFGKPTGSESDGTIHALYAVTTQAGVRNEIDLNIRMSGKIDELTQKKNQVIQLQAQVTGETGNGSVDGEWTNLSWENKKLNARNNTSKLSFKVSLPFLGIDNFSAVLNVAREDRLGIEPFTLPVIKTDTITDLNAATEKDLARLELEVMASFGTFYLSNKPIFDAFMGE